MDGRLNRNFLLRTKTALASVARLADELQESFPLHSERSTNGVSRTAAYLHLLYHQCIVLATRPLLFCFLKIRFESPQNCTDALNTSRNVRNLIQMCMESSQQIISILHSLQSEGLLGKPATDLLLTHLSRRTVLNTLLPRNVPPLRPRVHLRLNGSPPHRPRHRHPLELPAMGRKGIHNLRRHNGERQPDRQVPALRTPTPR